MTVGLSPAPSSAKVWFTTVMCSSKLGCVTSTTCSSTSASRVSSSVDLKLSTSACGSLRMKPTVSESKTGLLAARLTCRVVASSVANKRSSASTPASARAFISVDLPAFV